MKKINQFVFWLMWIIYLEYVYRFFIVTKTISINMLSVVLFLLPIISVLTILTSIFKEKLNKINMIVLSFLITVFTLAQIVYYNFYESIFSFFSLTTGTGQVMQFWSMILEVIGRIWYIFAIVIIPLLLLYIFNKKIITFKRLNYLRTIIYLAVLFLSLFGTYTYIRLDKKGIYSLNNLVYKTHAPMLTIEKTGLNTMQIIDLYRYITKFEEKELIIEDTSLEEEKEPEEKIIEYNKVEIDFDELIKKTNNSKVINMHNYFKTVEPTEKNEYTGMFEGKNLIFITAEGFDAIAIDPEITQTLYKMANNGFTFTNYFQPLYPISTSDGEYLNVTSLIPKEGVWSFKKSGKISMPYGIGNIFQKYGYITYGFHNHHYRYYDRHISHPNIGLKYIGCYNGLEKKMNCKHWPNSDNEMMQVTPEYYIDSDKPFMTYYMTVSGHLNYNFSGNNMASRHKKEVKNLKYSEPVKAYMATQIEFDLAMKTLLTTLEEKGKLDDTLIVISPDHYPYGLTKEQLNERSTSDRRGKFENYHTALIIYYPNIEKTVIDKTISSVDILPTVLNMFGIEFDSRLLMGRDIFSNQEHIVILSDRSWITDKCTYNSVNKKVKSRTGEEIPQEYVDRINSIVYKRFSMSSLILDTNYYSYLGLQ